MKNIRKIAALLIAAVLLLGIFPAALADSSSTFADTHWYAYTLNCDYIDWNNLSQSDRELLDLIGYFVKFVPYESWLENFSIMSIYCGIDFYANGTYRAVFAFSYMGEVDYDNYTASTGTWTYRDQQLIIDGNTAFPLTYRNGILSLSVCGIGFDFKRG